MASRCCIFLAAFYCCSVTVGARAWSAADFENPPSRSRPKFRYWFPDASVSQTTVADDVAAIADAGAGGIEFIPLYLYGLPAGGPPPTDWSTYGFGSTAFNSHFKNVLTVAEKAGISVDFALGANQGQGVPSLPMTHGLAVDLRMGGINVRGGQLYSGPVPPPTPPLDFVVTGLPFQIPMLNFGAPNLTAVTAMKILSPHGRVPVILEETSFVDLTDQIFNGNLNWTVPDPGSLWKIFSFWEHYTNQKSCNGGAEINAVIGNGSWVVDHFSQAGAKKVTDFWDSQILNDTEIASLLKTTGLYAWEDSMEMLSALYWTPGLLSTFQSRFNYSLAQNLPLIFTSNNTWHQLFPSYPEIYAYGSVTAEGESVDNLDYRAILNSGYEDYLSHFAAWSKSRGFKYSTQPAYNLPLQMLTDTPILDAPEGETLGFNDLVDTFRQLAGPAHLSGGNIISSEAGSISFPAYGQMVPDMLTHVKRSMAGGVNMHVIHGYPYSGDYPNTTWPGYTGFDYQYTEMWNTNQPCWRHMSDTLDYVGRCQFILQQGVPKIDLAFYLYSSPWSANVQYSSTNLQDLGFTYDYLSSENLLLPQAVVRNQTLAVSGPSYKAFIFSGQETITLEAVAQLARLASDGLPIIFAGPPPNQVYPSTPPSSQKLAMAMASLINQHNVYTVNSTDLLPDLLKSLGVTPRVKLQCNSNPGFPVWRSIPGSDESYCFFYNDQQTDATCNVTFDGTADLVPTLLNAWDGKEYAIASYGRSSNGIAITMVLRPQQTVIIAFRSVPANITSQPAAVAISYLNLISWNITIEDWHSTPNMFSVFTDISLYNFTAQALVPWGELAVELQASSGVGHYTTTFYSPPATTPGTLGAILSLGPVVHTMRVWIDTNLLPPIDPANPRLDISDYVHSGKTQTLTVEVTTPLFNRVKTQANRTWTWNSVAGQQQPLYATSKPQIYGLLGPVSITWLSHS